MMSTDSRIIGSGQVTGGSTEIFASQCVVTTFAGTGERDSTDGVGTAAGVSPDRRMCYSKASSSLLFIETGTRVRRVRIHSTLQMFSALAAIVTAGVEAVAPSLASISPLIDLIVSYAGNAGMSERSTAAGTTDGLILILIVIVIGLVYLLCVERR